jgi:hypothetical protein
MSELISARMVITDVTLDRERRDEKKSVATLKDLDYLCHLEKCYQNSTQATVFLRSEFQDSYDKFMNE